MMRQRGDIPLNTTAARCALGMAVIAVVFVSAGATSVDAPDSADAQADLQSAALAFDGGQTSDGVLFLDRAAAKAATAARQAGVAAYLYGQYAVATRCLDKSAGDDVALRLLEGNAALKAGQTDMAKAAFKSAMDQASSPADRLYAQERLIATARQAGDLAQLADSWLARKDLPADRALMLATMLRELGRAAELIDWWRKTATDPALSDTLLSERFVNEVLGTARSAGRSDDVVAICRQLMTRQPDDPRWLAATLRALLDQGRATEADTLLLEHITAAAKVPAALQRLGKLAESLGRDDAAVQASRDLVAMGGHSAMTGYLLESAIRRRTNDPREAADRLHHAAAIAEHDSDGLGNIVSALESADMVPAAIDLLQKNIVHHPSEDSLDRLASLLLKEHRSKEAMAILRQLMLTGSSEGIRAQASYRLLDAAQAAGSLDALIDELREKLQSSSGTGEDLSYLTDAYVRAQDIDSAAALLRGSPLLDRPTRLSRLAVLYLRAKKYEQAGGVLRDLVDADPENATQTLERLADVEMKLGRPDAAKKTIDQIAQLAGTGAVAVEMMGGVNDRLGRPAEAAEDYDRALSLHPESADDWLLWSAAMTKAGRGELAGQRLEALCGKAKSDEVFVAAVDGLLNMSAPTAVLRVARRDAILRVGQRPRQMMLYQVIADVSDQMQDSDATLRATDASVSISDEQRSQHLRELMDLASQSGNTSDAVNTGRSLLALGDDFPPDLFIQSGEQLLIGRHENEASQAFARARESSDADLIVNRIADIYEKCGYPLAALNTVETASTMRQSDAGMRETVARLNETLGHDDAAFENYLAAADIACGHLSVERKRSDPGAAATSGPTAAPRIIFGPSAAVMSFGRLVGGALATARSTEQQNALLSMLGSHLNSLMEQAAPGSVVPVDVAATAAEARRANFAFARQADADAVDEAVIAHWPEAEAFKHEALNARIQEGLIDSARSFAARFNLEDDAALLGAAPENVPTTKASAISPRRAAIVLPSLIVRGRLAEARVVLSNILVETPVGSILAAGNTIPVTAAPFQVIVSAAAVLSDDDTATRWALIWLDTQAAENPHLGSHPTTAPVMPFLAPASSAVVQRYQTVIDGAWPMLSHKGRLRLVQHLVQVLDTFEDSQARAALSMCALQAAAMLGERLPDTGQLADAALTVPDDLDQVMIAARVFMAVPAIDRPGVLHAAMASVPADHQLDLLIRIIGLSTEPLDAETVAAMTESAGRMGSGQEIIWGNWFLNISNPPLLGAVAEAVLRSVENQVAPDAEASTAAAAAFANIGDSAHADQAARLAVEALRAPPSAGSVKSLAGTRQVIRPRPGRVGLLRLVISSMSPAEKAAALENVGANTSGSLTTNIFNQPLVRAVLLDSVGRRTDALAALRAAYRDDPSDAMTARAYADRLQDDGRWAELVETFSRRDAGSDFESRQLRTIVERGLMELLRGHELRSDITKAVSSDLAVQALSGDNIGMTQSLRILLRGERNTQGFFTFPPMPSSGGLATDCNASDGIMAILSGFPEWTGALQDAMQSVRVPAESVGVFGRDTTPSWPAILIARAAAAKEVRDQIFAALRPAAAAHMLTRTERQLITAIASSPEIHVPDDLLNELLPAALADTGGGELLRLGNALVAQKNPGGNDVVAWAKLAPNARGIVQGPTAVLSPMRRQEDASLAEGLAELSEMDLAAAETELQRERALGRLGPEFWRTNCLWARLAAERGDASAFRQRVDELLRFASEVRITPVPGLNAREREAGLDLRLTLPIQQTNGIKVRDCLYIVEKSLAALAGKQRSNTDISRQMAAVADWAAVHGDKEAAETLYLSAKTLAAQQGPGEHQLWIADVAAKLGHDDVATSIERELIEDRCLPPMRIPAFLGVEREKGDAAEVLKITAKLAQYCPALVQGDFANQKSTDN